MLKDFEPRLYQQTIFSSCSCKNSLVVLPTGMGKTNIFLMIAAHRLKLYPKSKILLLGPTRPLIQQYMDVFTRHMEIEPSSMAVFTGQVQPQKRAELWKKSRIIFSTPQGLENDIISKRIDISEVSLLGIDEAHRAVGDYAYVFVARMFNKRSDFPLIVGMTASPGSDMEKIEEVCNNLFIENIEARSDSDPDVAEYVKEVRIKTIKVKLPEELEKCREILKNMLKARFIKLKEWGVLKRKDLNFVSKTELLELQSRMRGIAAGGDRDYLMWNAISVLAEVMKLYHGLELLESQGIIPLHNYIDSIYKESFRTKTKAIINIARDPLFREVIIRVEKLVNYGVKHPKLIELVNIVAKELEANPDSRILIFNQYRDNVSVIESELRKISAAKPSIFIGQAKKKGTGLSQKEQKELVEKFSKSEFNVVVSTSIGEEGLDIPKVDTVILYEPVPSAIRTIQRKGRTGRLDEGKVIILMAEGTRDEAYKWSAHHKELRMHRNIKMLKTRLKLKSAGLERFQKPDCNNEEHIFVYADHREKGNRVVKGLMDLGVEVRLKAIEASDYVLSRRVGVEYKTVEDFVNSIIDGRLMSQVKELKRNFERPLLIIEGEEDIYSARNVHPNAIRGMISNIVVSYGIPLLRTKNHQETAGLMKIIARREQLELGRDFDPHFEKGKSSLKEQIEYTMSSFPGVGIATARDLLKEFGSIRKIANSDAEKLTKVGRVGDKTSSAIREIFDSDYRQLENRSK